MYKQNKRTATSAKRYEAIEGETIEMKIERVVNNGEPISDGAPLIYTEREDGVMAGYNIRTDRFEVAIDAMDKVQKSHIAKRSARAEEKKVIKLGKNDQKDGGAEPVEGTT